MDRKRNKKTKNEKSEKMVKLKILNSYLSWSTCEDHHKKYTKKEALQILLYQVNTLSILYLLMLITSHLN